MDSRFVLSFQTATIFMIVIFCFEILLKHVKQDSALIISCHYSVCVIYDLFKAG